MTFEVLSKVAISESDLSWQSVLLDIQQAEINITTGK